MSRRIRLAEPPPVLDTRIGISASSSSIINNDDTMRESMTGTSSTRHSVVGLNHHHQQQQHQQQIQQQYHQHEQPQQHPVAIESMMLIHGRSFIAPNSEFARAVVMRNNDETGNSTTMAVPQPIQVSNLTMLLNEQLGIATNGLEEISADAISVHQRPETSYNNNTAVDNNSTYHDTYTQQQINTNYASQNNTSSSSWQRQQHQIQQQQQQWSSTPIDSGSSAEADSASGPPPMTPPAPPTILSMPRRTTTSTQNQVQAPKFGLGSSAPSKYTNTTHQHHRVVMFQDDVKDNRNENVRNAMDLPNVQTSSPLLVEKQQQQEQERIALLSSVNSSSTMFSNRVRRCMSSKELGTLAPPSGSPYGTMIHQMEALETEMKEKFVCMRRETTTITGTSSTNTSENVLNSDESQISTTTTTSSTGTTKAQQVANANERANEMRTRRRAEHTQAVVDDLCKIVADLFIAEAKLLNPFNYGVVAASASANSYTSASASDAVVTNTGIQSSSAIYDSTPTTQMQEQYQNFNNIHKSIQNFVTSLPSRYVYSADTPSAVLLHMRLMAAVRNDKSKAVVHIHNFSDEDKNWNLTVTTGKGNRSLRLVTISCHDAVGLLEYVTRLLSSGGSRVLDADVMLSSDGIVLDRFVVEMIGRLRLDKLSNSIESFLSTKNDSRKSDQQHTSVNRNEVFSVSGVVENEHQMFANPPLSPHKYDIEPTGPLYYQVERTPEPYVMNEKNLQEIKSGVPLAEFLTKTNSHAEISKLVPNFVRRHHINNASTPSIPSLRFSTYGNSTMSATTTATSTAVPPMPEVQSETVTNVTAPTSSIAHTVEAKQPNKRRVLLDRPATSFLDDSERNVLVVNTASSVSSTGDYVTVQPYAGIGASYLEQRVVPLIPFDEIMLIETIGSGRVSTIYRAAWQKATSIASSVSTVPSSNIRMVALKVAMVNPVTNDTANVDELRREADIAARLEHSNVVELVGVAADPECFCLAYDYCDGGSLLSLLSDHTRYYEYLPIALDIANGMAYLHSRNVIHRDLKPSNILMTSDHRAKIADFGMSVANFGQELTAETGTYRYMAPEVIRHESYSSNADVYSFGLVLWQIITREVPFANLTPIQAAYAVAEGRRPIIPSDTPRRLKEIILSCWHQDSHRRPSFTYITMALADYAKMAFSPANVGALTLQIANETLASVEGNSTVNVDISTPVGMYLQIVPGSSPARTQAATAQVYGVTRHDSFHSNIGLDIE